jgi:hypothetical protein
LSSSTMPPPTYASNVPAVEVSPMAPKQICPPFCPTLESLRIEPRKLEDCFSLSVPPLPSAVALFPANCSVALTCPRFFQHYHPILPILEPQYAYMDYYTYSPILFWTIVVTGSRRYRLDPTLLDALAPRVSRLAALATTRLSDYIATISALLILCVWPLPIEDASEDPSPVYSGIIMQLCLQNGLHMHSKRQDFSHAFLIKDTTQEKSRACLWAWCKVVCHW